MRGLGKVSFLNGVALSLFLVGCSAPKNPLLNEDSMDLLRSYIAFSGDASTGVCPKHWANPTDSSIEAATKTICDKQIKIDYDKLDKQRQDILKGATFEQYRSPEVWQVFLNQKALP